MKKIRKGSQIAIPKKAGYPDIKVKVLDHNDKEVVCLWGIHKIRINRSKLV